MRKAVEVLRLRIGEGLSERQVAHSCGISRPSVRRCLERAEEAGIGWPLPEDMTEGELEKRLYQGTGNTSLKGPLPDMEYLHKELMRKGVTLQLLWQEYVERYPEGYQYSQFCEHYRQWKRKLDVTMRQVHKAGEKLFVDFAGQTVPIVDPHTGVIHDALVFVATLGASNYTYAEAVMSEGLADWISCHIHAFEYLQGVTAIVVPDNLKSGVNKACRYEPDINRTYLAMAGHYGVAVIPTRIIKPKDKAKVEKGVQDTERRLLAPLRDMTFFSLAELNKALWELLERHNSQPFQKLAGSRLEMFRTIDAPALRPLPLQRYEYAEWKMATVNMDYHIELEKHYYSVPYKLVRETVDISYTATTVEILFKGTRMAMHQRSFQKHAHSTIVEHMPEHHRRHGDWPPSRIIRWAESVGLFCAQVAQKIINNKPHPEQGYRACMGLIRLANVFGTQRMEAACQRALYYELCTYRNIRNILETASDRKTLPDANACQPAKTMHHENLRGSAYYN